jgi:type I restriction enzyme S subunit
VNLPAYPKYKPSGVEWLGEVPEHWEAMALKRGNRVVNGGTPPSGDDTFWDGGIVWFTPEDLGSSDAKVLLASRRTLSREGLANCGAVLSPLGSVLLSTRAPIGHVGVTGVEGCCNQGCRLLVPDSARTCADYVYFVLIACKPVLQSLGKGSTFVELSAGALASFPLPRPNLLEQQAIAAFLDRETARIDRLVAKKRELIERLKEKRTALISRTVTRGLPPAAARAAGLPENPPLKSSGVDWLGEIASHWRAIPLKHLVATPITDGPHETPEILDEGIPFVSAEAISGGKINFERIRGHISAEDHRRYSKKYKPKRGDIYMVKSGATTGRVAMVETDAEFNIWSPLAAIRCDPRLVDRDFVFLYLQSREYQAAVALSWSFGTQQNIGMGVVQDLAVPVPPLSEQRAIAAFLKSGTVGLDSLVAKVESAIERLEEYRTALITAAVTGKIDVRREVPA